MRSWRPPDRASAQAEIRAAFPTLPARSVRELPGGWDFLTLEVDRKWIFRFPARPPSEAQIRREFDLLPLIASHVGVPVPEYRFRSEPDRRFPHRFGGYARLGGVRVDRAGLTGPGLARVGRELGAAVARLHAIPAPRAVAAGLSYRTAADTRRGLLRWRREMAKLVRPLLDRDSRRRLDTLLGRLVLPELHRYQPAVIHNDLLPAHVLVDPRAGRLTGLIDWGDVEFGDPAFDLGVLGRMPGLGPAMWAAYRGRADRDILERADAYRRLIPAHTVVHGREIRDPVLRERGLRQFARALASAGPANPGE